MSQGRFYTLKNKNGTEIKLFDYGAALAGVRVPDKNGKFDDVVFGFDDLKGYAEFNDFFGSTVGRHAGRIGGGRFEIDGNVFQLAVNNGKNHLHGGIKGFDKVFWNAQELSTKKGNAVSFSYLSPDGEEHYPGNLTVTTVYTLTDADEIIIDMYAVTDKATPVNLTNHTYFNLSGAGNPSILDHRLKLNCDFFLPGDEGLIPTGEVAPVDGTPLDFREFKAIGKEIDADHPSTKFGSGYDLAFVVNGKGNETVHAASVIDDKSGRRLDVFTNQKALIFYTGNFLKGDFKAKDGKTYPRRSGFCLEPGAFPDSPNKPWFPDIILKPGELYHNQIIFRFGIEN